MSEFNNDSYNLWGGRFTSGNEDIMKQFNESFSVDKRMWREDIEASIQWARSILNASLVNQQEYEALVKGLEMVRSEWEDGKFFAKASDEDIHTANERRLKELVGDVAMKLHTGRSRNDQVATDMRLWLVANVQHVKENIKNLIRVLVNRGEKEIDVLMPGYTHLQRAQPIRWSHLLMSYAAAIDRDLERLNQLQVRANLCPLGSGAIAGNPFKIDRKDLAERLNFHHETINSIDSIQSRDFIYEFMFVASSIAINLSKFAEDMLLYSTKEFSFIKLSDSYSTGSSLMPQKKNGDSLELIRGKCGRIFGRFSGFMMTMKALPTSYNKDLQEDKEAMFDVYDTVNSVLKIAAGVLETLRIDDKKMKDALSVDLLATDLAYYLVRKGVPFRQAHSLAGHCVALAEKTNCQLSELKLGQLKAISDKFEEDINEIWNMEASVEQYSSIGGTAKASVQAQISSFKGKVN